VGYTSELPDECDLLINIAEETPDFADSFVRIAELVSSDEDSKNQGRKRFAAYRKKGCELAYHDIG
jgi:DNA polymerase-3 subunit chi